MVTPIVYVVISDESDCYLEQACLSAFSLRIHNPTAMVILITDNSSNKTFKGKRHNLLYNFDKVIEVDVPDILSKMQRSRYIKTSLRRYLEGDYLYIDSDTIIADKLDDIDSIQGEIGAVKDLHLNIDRHSLKQSILTSAKKIGWSISNLDTPYYNSGVLYVKDTPNTRSFYEKWHKYWIEGVASGRSIDQPSFGKTISGSSVIITELDGVWNCQVTENGLRFLAKAKIIHYFASHSLTNSPYSYLFQDQSIYTEIKQHGKLSDKIKLLIAYPKEAFPEKLLLISDMDVDFFFSPITKSVRLIYYSYPTLWNKVEIVLRKIRNWLFPVKL